MLICVNPALTLFDGFTQQTQPMYCTVIKNFEYCSVTVQSKYSITYSESLDLDVSLFLLCWMGFKM